MKLHKSLLLFGVSSLLLTACGDDGGNTEEENTNEESETEVVEQVEEVDTEETEETVEEDVEEEEPEQTTTYPSESYAELPATYETDHAIYEITNITKSTGSMTGTEIVSLEMEFTNKGNEPTSPYMRFISDFDAQQTDGVTTESLMGANSEMANLEDQEAVSMGDTQVNGDATVHATIGYTLDDPELDVGFILRSSQISGEPQGFAWMNE